MMENFLTLILQSLRKKNQKWLQAVLSCVNLALWPRGGSDLQAGGRGWTLLLPYAAGLVTPVTVIAERWGEAVTELGLGRQSRQRHLLWLGQGRGRLLTVGGDI